MFISKFGSFLPVSTDNLIPTHATPVLLCKLPNLSKLSVRGNPFVSDFGPDIAWRDTQSLLDHFKVFLDGKKEKDIFSSKL